jgi:sec-independent protein translocase protein TatA
VPGWVSTCPFPSFPVRPRPREATEPDADRERRKAYKWPGERTGMTSLLQIGIPGGPELLLIVGVLVLLFGASKLPKLARSMGSATGEFKKGRQEVEQELEDIQESPSDEDEEVATEAEADGSNP